MTGRVDVVASHAHFVDHLAPIWLALPPQARGGFKTTSHPAAARARRWGIRPRRGDRANLLLVATWAEVQRSPGRRVVYVEHGAGQSYGGEPLPGAVPDPDDGCPVVLALVPSERVARRIRLHHPHADVVVCGPPRLDRWAGAQRSPSNRPCVALAWHWDSPLCDETRTAFPHWQRAVAQLPALIGRSWEILGHGHPRAMNRLGVAYRSCGIAPAPDPDAVFERADVLVADNTSFLYEFAALDRPVVLVDAPWYRRDVDHGMRFWQHADMGLRCGSGDADELVAALAESVAADPRAERRRQVVSEVWGSLDGGAAQRAADAILPLA